MLKFIFFMFAAYIAWGWIKRAVRPRIQQVGLHFFLKTVFGLLAKMAKADGVVSPEEIDAINHWMRVGLRFDEPTRKAAVDAFNEAKASDRSFESYADEFMRYFHRQPQLLRLVYQAVATVAQADGYIHPEEKRYIDILAQKFGVSAGEAQAPSRGQAKDPYQVLGVSPQDSFAKIKTRYRKLAREYHPDVVTAKGLPPEFTELANQKIQEINQAFDTLKARHSV